MKDSRKEEISASLTRIRSDIPDSATLIVVTKTFPVSDVEILYELGERNFGENRDEEGSEKSKALPEDAICTFKAISRATRSVPSSGGQISYILLIINHMLRRSMKWHPRWENHRMYSCK